VRRGLEFEVQDVGEAALSGFDDGAGVMGDQPAQHDVGVLGVAQVAGAVEGVRACHGEGGRVADIVQLGGSFQEIGVSAEYSRQAACPRGDSLHVRPAAGEGLLEKCPGKMFSPRSQRVHTAKARQRARDVHGRDMPPEDVLLSIGVPSS
jgi:hypothetical protein